MRSVRDVFYIGWQCFEKNMKHPRILLVFSVFFCMILNRIGMFNTAAKLTGTSNTPWFLPFLLADGFSGFYILLEFVLIFCDAPFIDSHQPYVIIRTGKTKWLLGQLLYILWMSLFCVLSLQLFMIIVLLPTISFTTDWGNIIYTLSRMPIKDFQPEFQIYYALVERYTPLAATAYSGLILWLQGAIIGCLMLLFNFFIKKRLGTAFGCMYAGSYILINLRIENIPLLWKIIPSLWIDIGAFSKQYIGTHPGITYVVIGSLLIIGVCCLIMLSRIKKQPIEVLEQV